MASEKLHPITKTSSDTALPNPTPRLPEGLVGPASDLPPTRAEFEQLATQVRRLAAQVAHGRA